MQDNEKLRQMILDYVYRENYRPVKPKTIARKLGDEVDERDVKRAIKRLVKDEQLTWGSNHLVHRSAKPSKESAGIEGIFRKASGGYGFVTPLGDHPLPAGVDIFIPERKTLDAANGDRVRVRLSKKRKSDPPPRPGEPERQSGRILEVLDRKTHRFVGTYREQNGFGLVRVDGDVFESDIHVGDASAKNCRAGDKVVIDMVHFPAGYEEGEAVIVEVLGPRGRPGVDTLTVIHEFGLPGAFSDQVLDDARAVAELFDDETVPSDRTDFTGETIVTIDPREARDFDDAIGLVRLENGHWRLGVHIADVSHFVRPNTELDNEAYRRGTSIYLPDRVIPMLPEIISNNLASLQPNRNRYVTSAVIEFTEQGVPVATDFHRGVICSAHRFNYEEIDEYLADDRPWKDKLSTEVFDLVRRMHSLAMILRERRLDRGAIELSLPEVKIELDQEGRACGAHQTEHTESHQIIEEFMLAANQAVARELTDRGYHVLSRIHEPPSPVKLRDLNSFVQAVGIEAGSLEDRFEIKRVISASAGRPEEYAVHYAVLRSMQKAIYSPRDVGHYALNTDHYCHFTSPIRRYPDLIIHRMVGAIVAGNKPAADFERLSKLGFHCSELEQRAEQAERTLIKLKLLNLLLGRVDEEFHAVITGVESYGLFAQLQELPIDGLVPLDSLPADRYSFDKSTRTLSGFRSGNLFRLGDPLRVRIRKVDPGARELTLELVEKPKASNPKRGTEKKTAGASKKIRAKVSSFGAKAKAIGDTARKKKKKGTRSQNGKKKKVKSKTTRKKNSQSRSDSPTGKSKSAKKAKSGKARAKQASKRKSVAAVKKRMATKQGRKSKGKRR